MNGDASFLRSLDSGGYVRARRIAAVAIDSICNHKKFATPVGRRPIGHEIHHRNIDTDWRGTQPESQANLLCHGFMVRAEIRGGSNRAVVRIEHADPCGIGKGLDELTQFGKLSVDPGKIVYKNGQLKSGVVALCRFQRGDILPLHAGINHYIRLANRGWRAVVRSQHRDDSGYGNFCGSRLRLCVGRRGGEKQESKEQGACDLSDELGHKPSSNKEMLRKRERVLTRLRSWRNHVCFGVKKPSCMPVWQEVSFRPLLWARDPDVGK